MMFFSGSYSNNIFPETLSKEEEEKYLKLFLEKKDKNARNTLIEHNLRLVAHIVKKQRRAGFGWLFFYCHNANNPDLVDRGCRERI